MLEPDSVIVLGMYIHIFWLYHINNNASEKSSSSSTRSTLFMRRNVPSQELWDGPRTGLDAAPDMFAVDDARDIESLSSHLSTLLPTFSNVFLDTPKHSAPRKRSLNLLNALSTPTLSNVDTALGKVAWSKVQPLSREVHQLRKLKSPAEIALMRKSADLSGNAHAKVV